MHLARRRAETAPPRSVFLLFALMLWTTTANAQWVKKPSPGLLAQTPGLVHETFESDAMKTTVGYSVVLPPSYESNPQRRFPVVYWLHGGGGNECSSLYTAKSWRDLNADQKIGEVILVYPNGFRSGYMDHHDGKIMNESMIIQELVPRIDRRFRTIRSRSARAAHGFSMGSSGSLKFVFKYPHLFSAAVAYGGGAIDLEHSKSRFILDILERNLRSDPKLIRENNTYHFLARRHDEVRQRGIKLMLICGEKDSWRKSAEDFQAALKRKNIACPLKLVPDAGHNLRALIKAEGAAAAIFQDEVFREALKTPSDPQSATTIQEAYYSQAEERNYSFQVVLPPGFSRNTSYPLFVQVFGSNALMPTRDRPFIRVRPTARGVWGYRSMSRYDVMRVIQQMLDEYPVDANRIYITGTSAGATGVMHAAAQRPDVFAGIVPLVAFGNDLPLENFRNLPIRCEHGVNDWTSAIGNVRVQFQKIAKLKYDDAVLNEHPKAGHGIRTPPPNTISWLFERKRNPSPKQIVYSCEHPRDGRAYWLTIDRFTDPHKVARIKATVSNRELTLVTNNIQQVTLDLDQAPLKDDWALTVDGGPVAVAENVARTLSLVKKQDGWRVAPGKTPLQLARESDRLAYGAGAAGNLLQGEPLLVVYGTGGDDGENRFLQQAAQILARSGGPDFKPANVRFPTKSDTAISDLPLDKYNLLLVGTAENNALLRRLAMQLPYEIEEGVLRAGDRKPLELSGSVLSFYHFNPLHPKRAIYVVSPYLDAGERAQFLKNPRVFLAGSDSFKMIDRPDLMVRRADHRICREMQLDADWRFIKREGAAQRIPARFSDRTHLALAHLKVMHKMAAADLAIWWGPEDKGLFGGYDFNWLPTFDPEHYTAADYLVRRRGTETMTAALPGDELQDIFKRWIATEELVTWPTIKRDEIQSDRTYRIVIPMDLVPKLGIRRRVLAKVAPGPDIPPRRVAEQIFGELK